MPAEIANLIMWAILTTIGVCLIGLGAVAILWWLLPEPNDQAQDQPDEHEDSSI